MRIYDEKEGSGEGREHMERLHECDEKKSASTGGLHSDDGTASGRRRVLRYR